MDASQLLQNIRLMPVVVIEDDSHAVQLAETLLQAGITAIEITLRTECALAAMEKIAKAVPDILLGAGRFEHLLLLSMAGPGSGHRVAGTRPGHGG